jgi:hypothetical protein
MRSAIVTETVRPLEPLSIDPFIVGLPLVVRVKPAPAPTIGPRGGQAAGSRGAV